MRDLANHQSWAGGPQDLVNASAARRAGPLVPYGAVMVGVWGLIGLEPDVRAGEVAGALGLQILVAVALAFIGRWGQRRWAGGAVIVAFLASVALLRAGVGSEASYGSLVLLPVLWAAWRRRRSELAGSLVGAAAVLFIPIVLAGGSQYPSTGWRSGGLIVIVAAVFGLTVLALIDRQGRDLEQLRVLAGGVPDGCFVLFDPDLRYLMAGGPALGDFALDQRRSGSCRAGEDATLVNILRRIPETDIAISGAA